MGVRYRGHWMATPLFELLPTSFRDLGVFWGNLQSSVKQLEWQSAPPILSPWFSLGKKWHVPSGSGRASALSGGVKASWGLVREWGKDGVWDWQVNRCRSISHEATVSVTGSNPPVAGYHGGVGNTSSWNDVPNQVFSVLSLASVTIHI